MQSKVKHICIAAGVVGAAIVLVALIVCLAMKDSNTFSKFERCDKTNSTVEEFKVQGCKRVDKDVCILEPGQEVKVTIKFAADKSFLEATTRFAIEDHGDDYDSCKSGVNCPSQAGQVQSYEQIVHISERLPRHSSPENAFFYLHDMWDISPLVCVMFSVKII